MREKQRPADTRRSWKGSVRLTDRSGKSIKHPDDGVREALSVSVRVLAEAVHRSGGLSGIQYGLLTAAVGVRTHRRFADKLQDRFPEAVVQKELPLSDTLQLEAERIILSGRCDAIVTEQDQVLVIEAKTYLGPVDLLPAGGEPVHWAQAALYAALYVRQSRPGRPVRLALAYVAADTIDITLLVREISPADLDTFLTQTARSWSETAAKVRQWVLLRDESGKALSFPYPALRSGQRRLMKEVVGIARHRLLLFASAPTGTGKTMAVLYPGIKALCHHLTDRIFYLTAMTSTRKAAEKACDDLREKGLTIRSVTLTAKEKICLKPELFCDIRQCPLAIHYYDHLGEALAELLTVAAVDEGVLRAVAGRYQVCPFELSLDLALYADIVICDYNYAFDPLVRLDRFFGQSDEHDLLLVDEAHNLPTRAREMFTARLSLKALRETAKAVAHLHPPLDRSLQAIIGYFDRVQSGIRLNEPAIDQAERGLKSADVMVSAAFRATRTRPATLNTLLGRAIPEFRALIDGSPDLPDRRLVLDTYFSFLFFLRVTEEFDPAAYVTTYTELPPEDLEIALLCLDASDFLRQQIQGRHAAVFFSATLNPMDYYQSLIVGKDARQQVEQLTLPSPFPDEHLLVMRCTRLSTRFADRTGTVQGVARMIEAALTFRTGNYLVFVPSFAYLDMIRPLLKSAFQSVSPERDETSTRLIFQKPQMSDREKSAFLQAFSRFGRRTLVGVAVIGGQFSEGIDLVGEQLSGVVIVGVGLPQLCPEREIMRQYFSEKLGSGFEYAYQFPGFNRVQQAAGRVIRSETDRGFVLLIDDRFKRPDYEALFPAEWNVRDVDDEATLVSYLNDFYGS